MKGKRRPEIERLQDSVSYFPDIVPMDSTKISNRSKYFNNYFVHMFIEDVKLSIMPIGGRSSNKLFGISLEPPDPGVQRIVEDAISPGDYHSGLASEVCDFISQCAVELLLFDRLTYEIVFLSEKKSGKIVGFEFLHINPLTLVHEGNKLVQVLSDEVAAKLGKATRIELKPERVLTFDLPNNLQGKMDQIIEPLAVLSSPTTPEFFMNELTSGSMKTPYEAKTHIYTRNVSLANSTKHIGWNARWLFQDEALEYYLIHRDLLFERFKIELRDNILNKLNEGVKRAGEQLGFTAEVVITGLPTIVDVQSTYDHLQKGDIPFADILKPFRGF